MIQPVVCLKDCLDEDLRGQTNSLAFQGPLIFRGMHALELRNRFKSLRLTKIDTIGLYL